MANVAVETMPFKVPDKIPPGNWLARQIRLLNEDSAQVFPKSAGSQRPYDKYSTVYKINYKGPTEFDPSENEPSLQPKPKIKQTIADALLTPHLNQMFVNWKVPENLVPADSQHKDDAINEADAEQNEKKDDLEDRWMSVNLGPATKRYTPGGLQRQKTYAGKVSSPVQEKTRVSTSGSTVRQPEATRASVCGSVQKQEQPMLIRQMSLPLLHSRSPHGSPRNAGHRAFQTVANERRSVTQYPITLGTPHRSSGSGDVPDNELTKEDLEQSLQPHAIAKAEDWFKKASKSDRKVIERLLRMTEKRSDMDNKLKKSLLPDCTEAVEKWLENTNEKERYVALSFFNSLTGSRLMGMTAAEQRKRLQQVIDALENGVGKSYDPTREHPQKYGDHDFKRARHIKIMTPNTRRNRWMHTTWHHLPSHKNKKNAENFSSHFFRPLEPIPRHFVIHPDWG